MALLSGYGQTSYRRTMEYGLEGQAGFNMQARTFINPSMRQSLQFVVGGTAADGEYSITIYEPDGTAHVIGPFDRADSETSSEVAAELRDLAPASAVGVFTVEGSGANVVVNADHPDVTLTYAVSAPAGATITASTLQTPGVGTFRIGHMVIAGTEYVDGLPTLASVGTSEPAFAGIIARQRGFSANEGSIVAADVDIVGVGPVSVAYSDEIYVVNRGSVTSARNGLLYVVTNTAGGQNLGAIRANADSTNTTAVTQARGFWIDPTAPGEVGRVYLRM